MSISSLNLDAFLKVAQEKSFSKAANQLHITQSALSQRIANLEKNIGHTLFIRQPNDIFLTPIAHHLLQYCLQKEALEKDFIKKITHGNKKEIYGTVKIGTFSSIGESIIVPLLSEVVKKHPQLEIDLLSRELLELPDLLMTGRVDFIFLNSPIEKMHLENHLLGFERYVLVESAKCDSRKNIYLDHDENDTLTSEFLSLQKSESHNITINYFDNINLIISAVGAGIGRAVIPLHIAKKTKTLHILKGHKTLKKSVYLVRHKQAYYPESQHYLFKKFCCDFKDYT